MQKFSLNYIKSFENSKEIEIKPITILVGKNSCGKSSLLRFPVVLAQTFREETITPLLLFGSMIDYGNYDDVAYRHESSPLGFKVSFGRELERFITGEHRNRFYFWKSDFLNGVRNLKVELQVFISKPLKKLEVEKTELFFDGFKVCTLEYVEKNRYFITIHRLRNEATWEQCNEKLEIKDIRFDKFIPFFDIQELVDQICENGKMIKKNGKPLSQFGYFVSFDTYVEENIYKKNQLQLRRFYETISIISAYFRGISKQLEHEAANLAYIGPFRENPERIYRDSESSYNDVGVSGENTSMLLRQAAQEDNALLQNVSNWLEKTMGYTLDIKEVGNGLYSLVVRGNGEIDNIMDVGYGISQVLPIVTQLYNIDRDNYSERMLFEAGNRKTVIFEQPEIHLHPAAQAQLADLFVDCINNKKGGVNRILIETHSEHLIRKLQVLVADPEVEIGSDQVAIYYVDKDKDGNSFVEKMDLCDNGQFEKVWPSGFFDKNYELTKLLMKANQKISQQEKK